MQQLNPLFETPELSVAEFRCRVAAHRRPEAAEQTRGWEIVFLRRGLFVLHASGRETVVTPNSVVFLSPETSYRIEHPRDGGDDCTIFSVKESTIDAMLGRARRSELFSAAHALSAPGAYLAHYALWRRLANRGDALGIEEGVWRLVDLLGRTHGAQGPSRNTPGTRSAVRRVMELLGSRFPEPLRLPDLAKEAGMSPFHLSRAFRDETGIGIHACQNRLRLRAALERIAQGEEDLTSLALDLGFSSHSHFTTAFTAEYGSPPAAVRSKRAGLA